MSPDTQSVKAKVASDGPREAPALSDQPDTQKSSGQKTDMDTIFKEALERAQKMTSEEMLEKHPWMKNNPPRPVDAGSAMPLEEMEKEDAAAAWAEDGPAGVEETP